MAKYHVNPEGNVGVCRATKSCPFGDEEQHYSSKEEARSAYEKRSEVGEVIRQAIREMVGNGILDLGVYDSDWFETQTVGSEEWNSEVKWLEDAIAECLADGDEDSADAYDTVLCAVKHGEAHWNQSR